MSLENPTPVLLVDGLRKIYPAPTPQAEAVEAIRNLTFSIPRGSWCASSARPAPVRPRC